MPLRAGPTGVRATSATSWNSVSARSAKRNCPRLTVPPGEAAFASRTARDTSSGVIPSARAFSGITSTRISSSGAPTTATLATPASCSSRRACTSCAVRAIERRSPGPVRPNTAIGRSPGSLVSSVGRSARLRQPAAGIVEPLAHREHRGRHVGAPGEFERRHRLAVAAHRAHIHESRRRRHRFLDRLRDEARDLGRGSALVGRADREHRQRHVGQQRDREPAQRDRAEQAERDDRRDGGDRPAERRGGERH